MRLHPLHRYVGPPEIARAAEGSPRGVAVRSAADLAGASRTLRERVLTYVLDAEGTLRVAPRSSEHVACARGGLVFAAGELTITTRGDAIEDATNLSTGYCPRVSCLDALTRAIDAAGIARPVRFETRFEMRRCTCGARVVVKDDVFECAECGADVPKTWNFSRARFDRAFSGAFVVDVLVEPGERDEDRVVVDVVDEKLRFVLADGAGNSGRGSAAAERACAAISDVGDPSSRLVALDGVLAAMGAEAAVVIGELDLASRAIDAAAAGDTRVWMRTRGTWTEATEGMPRKPMVGSGARPKRIVARGVDAWIAASDGLVRWVGPDVDHTLLAHDDAMLRLADSVRLRSGALADDLSIVWMRARG